MIRPHQGAVMLYWDTALVGAGAGGGGGGGAAAEHQAGCDVLKAFVFKPITANAACFIQERSSSRFLFHSLLK